MCVHEQAWSCCYYPTCSLAPESLRVIDRLDEGSLQTLSEYPKLCTKDKEVVINMFYRFHTSMHLWGLKRWHHLLAKSNGSCLLELTLSVIPLPEPLFAPAISFSFVGFMYRRCPSDKRPPWQPALSMWVQPFSFRSEAKSIAFLPLPSSSTTSSTIPELTADGVLIKSSRNRTVSKQCSTCQLSNCWALLQPLCLAREGRMRGGEDKKEREDEAHTHTHTQRTKRKWEKKRTRENQKKEKARDGGYGGYGRGGRHTHLAAGARKAQLVKVQGGHKEEGAEQSWDGMGWSRLCWAGLGQRVQSWASSLQAMGSKPSPRVPGLLCGLQCWHKANAVPCQTSSQWSDTFWTRWTQARPKLKLLFHATLMFLLAVEQQ